MHAHCAVPDVLDLVKGTAIERAALNQFKGKLGFPVADKRVADMDKDGIDVQALSINAFWYGADRDLARRIFDVQATKLAEMCKAIPGRFVGYAPVTLQHPEIAAEQLERGMKELGLIGAGIAGSVEGEELASEPVRSVLEEGRGTAGAGLHPPAGRRGVRDRHRQARERQRRASQRDRQSAGNQPCAGAPDLPGHARQISRT